MLSLSVVGMLTLLISLVAISGVALVLFLARVVIGD